tara:strand:+ start:583 stop:726 length:144 start_codon:yes stop_codon:yes gene_type:complete
MSHPGNDEILERLYEEVREEFPDAKDTVIQYVVMKRFESLPEPLDLE